MVASKGLAARGFPPLTAPDPSPSMGRNLLWLRGLACAPTAASGLTTANARLPGPGTAPEGSVPDLVDRHGCWIPRGSQVAERGRDEPEAVLERAQEAVVGE